MVARIVIVGPPSLTEPFAAKLRAEAFNAWPVTAADATAAITRTMPDLVIASADEAGLQICGMTKYAFAPRFVPVLLLAREAKDFERGEAAGADDFLTVPVANAALFTRVRSLVRLKMMRDELWKREAVAIGIGAIPDRNDDTTDDKVWPGLIVALDDQAPVAAWFASIVAGTRELRSVPTRSETLKSAIQRIVECDTRDLIVVNLELQSFEALSLCKAIRERRGLDFAPLIVLAREPGVALVKALDLGADDFLIWHSGPHESRARVSVALRRSRCAQRLFILAQMIAEKQRVAVTQQQQQQQVAPTRVRPRTATLRPASQGASLRERLTGLGLSMAGVVAVLFVLTLPAFFVWGTAYVGAVVMPWLIQAGYATELLCLIGLPFAINKATRGAAATGYLIASYVFGVELWFYACFVSYHFWGFTGVIAGVFLFGVGVVPVALLAAVTHGAWMVVLNLVVLAAFTYGIRFSAAALFESADRWTATELG